VQTDQRRRAQQRRQSSDDTASDGDSEPAGDGAAGDTPERPTGDDRSAENTVATVLERLIWTIMSSFSLLLAAGAAVLAVRADGPTAVGLALAAVVVAVSAAYFLYHMWRTPGDAQEF
jgi:hypothetical protein